ncbi:cyclase family protein [Noviherbaspirillum pedocola]|uniref:Cyclase family protein n=1 Tax=Noviherbaspirillum pedocola TaxID=2801341 RepID=A0A934SRW8_9BURK|nr:cyclase family protein [Noviherbaspirillum pedocola]MBK4735465.1 cyclase family protein [Noviherbaspirillum pedocola]
MSTRRQFLGAALSSAAALTLPSAQAASAGTGARSVVPPGPGDIEIESLLPKISNWGKWGPKDQLGTLNYITPALRLAAMALVKRGEVVPLAREVPVAKAEGVRRQAYEMKRYVDRLPAESGSMDYIGMSVHGLALTHVDALCHFFTPGGKQGMYNGLPIDAVTLRGAEKLGVEVMGATGIVGRGVLLDIAAQKGRALPLGSAILPADLEAAEKAQGVQVGEGDILFIRSGAGTRNSVQHSTGLHASCLPWLHERRVAALSADGDNEARPSPAGYTRWVEPIHMVAIPYLGMPLIDNAELEALAARCAREKRWAFLVSIAPWRMKGATASPVNPLAMF